MKQIWELRKQRALAEYRLANLRWRETHHPFFKEEMNYRAVIYRACCSISSGQDHLQDASLPQQGSGSA